MRKKDKKWLLSAVALAMSGTMGASIAFAEPFKNKSSQISGSTSVSISGMQLTDVTDQLSKESLYTQQYFNTQKLDETETLNVRANGKSRIIVELEDVSLLDKYLNEPSIQDRYEDFTSYVNANAGKTYAATLGKEQSAFFKALDKKAFEYEIRHTYTSIINAVSIELDRKDVSKVEKMAGVKSVIYSESYAVPQVEATENVVDVYDTGIYKAEGVEYRGDGLLIAVLDTGIDKSHNAFSTMPAETKLTKEGVEKVFANTEAATYGDTEITADDVYYNAKIPFAYDYADKDSDVFPKTSSHGVHVAGIIAGSDDSVTGEDAEAFENGEKFVGVAPNAQLMIGKVFPDVDDGGSEGAETDNILAALADCVTMGADVINMSLGTSSGYSRERDESAANEIYDKIYAAGINLVCAASNDYSSGMNGAYGSTNLTSNPDSATVGSPSSYVSALSVASISGVKSSYMELDTGAAVYFNESTNAAGQKGDFLAELLNGATEKTFNYVLVPGYGMQMNYNQTVKAELAKGNCIAVVARGSTSFEEKQKIAAENGAVACIIYNNLSGMISASLGTGKKVPTCTVSAEIGQLFKDKSTGTLTLNSSFKAGPFMSDFSSWGPTGDLKIKPEITAHGGEITSAVVGGYDIYSGTSMASPNMAGAVALLRQYVSENYDLTGVELANRVNQLLMSTATIVRDQNGLPYFVRKQGAGLGDIGKAISSEAYLYVENGSKPKLELGDDPEKTGVYTMNFRVANASDSAKTYTMDVMAMTETVSIDGITVAEKAHMLDKAQKSFRVNGKASGKKVTVPANGEVTVSVTLTLSAEEKKYLDENFENGMYVEGFVTLENAAADGVDLSIPYLAFYGDWNSAPIFDYSAYEVSEDYYNASIEEEFKRVSAVYESVAIGRYYQDYEDYYMPLGEYIYMLEDEADSGVTSSVDKISVGNNPYGIYSFYAMYLGLLRGAGEMTVKVQNTVTGEVIYEETEYNVRKSYLAKPAFLEMEINPAELGLLNNTKYSIILEATTAYDGGETRTETREFSFYVDYERPMIQDLAVRYEYDENDDRHTYLDLTLYDNHYLQSVQIFALPTKDGADYLTEYPIPVTTSTVRGGSAKVSVEITDWVDVFANNYHDASVDYRNALGLRVDDFALNAGAWILQLPESTVDRVGVNYTYNDATDGQTTASLAGSTLVLQPGGEDIDLSEEKNVTVRKADGTEVKATLSLDMLTYSNYSCAHTDAHGKTCGYVYRESEGLSYKKGDYYYDTATGEIKKKTEKDPEDSPSYPAYTLFTDMIAEPIVNNKAPDSKHFVCPDCGTEVTFTYNRRANKLVVSNFTKLTQDAMVEDVTWTTSNADVVLVENGKVYAVGEGNATITATAAGNEFSFDVSVEGTAAKTYLTGLSVGSYEYKNTGVTRYSTTGYASVDCGSVLRLYPSFQPWYIKSVSELKWTSSDPDAVEILATSDPDSDEMWADVICKEPGGAYVYLSSGGVIGTFTLVIGTEYELRSNMYFTEYNGAGYTETYEEKGETRKMLVIPANLGIYYMNYYDFTRNGPFYGNQDIDTVIVPEGVKTVGYNAFSTSSIRRIYLPSSIESIASCAFQNCPNLEEVYWYDASEHSTSGIVYDAEENTYNWDKFYANASENCTAKNPVIGSMAFAGSSKLSVFDFSRITAIYSNAFYKCSSLKKADLTKLRYCGSQVFAYTYALKRVTLGEATVLGAETFAESGVKTIDYYGSFVTADTFKNAVSLEEIVFRNDLEYIGQNAFYGCSSLETVTFNGSCASIGNYAFVGCSSLTEFSVPKGAKSIGIGAFNGCSSLKTLHVDPESNLEEVGVDAFTGCVKFNEVKIGGNGSSEHYAVKSNASGSMLTDKLGTKIIIVPAAYVLETEDGIFTVPAVSEIGSQAYENNASLNGKELIIPEGVISIGTAAFRGTGITKVVIPSTVTTIEPYAFAECEQLETVVFLCDIDAVPMAMFMGCTALKEIDLPESVQVIDAYAFGATGLESVKLAANVQAVGNYAFAANKNLTTLEFADNSSLYYIGAYAFANNTALEKVVMPDSVLYLGNAAFRSCTALTDLYISAGLRYMGDYAFASTPALTNVTIGDGVTEIGNYAFFLPQDQGYYYQTKMASITIPESVQSIGAFAFAGNTALTSISLPGVYYIGEAAFYGTTNLKNVTLGENAYYIAGYAFYESGAENVNLDNVEYFGSYSFYHSGVAIDKTHTIESAVVVSVYAFAACENITELTLTNAKYIYSGAFYMPDSLNDTKLESKLTKVTFGNRLIGLGGAVFFNSAITEISLPASLEVIGLPAFAGCFELTSIEVDENNETYFVESDGLYKRLENGGYELVAVPNGLVMNKIADTVDELDPFKIIDGTVRVAPHAMQYCLKIHAVEIPASVKTIGAYAFYYVGMDALNENYDKNKELEEQKKYYPQYIFKGLEAPALETYYDEDYETIVDIYVNFSYPAGYLISALNIPVNSTGFENYIYLTTFFEYTYSAELIESGTQTIMNWLDGLVIDELTLADEEQVSSMQVAYSMLKDGQKAFFTSEQTAKLDSAVAKIEELQSEAEPDSPAEPTDPDVPSEPTDPSEKTDDKKGCSSSTSIGAAVAILLLGAVMLLNTRKRRSVKRGAGNANDETKGE